jgi:NAD(P)-dependent dehydrogenase (short-subunit alcohol dehydrogenase family)
MGRVEGKVALITGAARGQGRSHAIRLAEEGADIIAVDLCAPIDTLDYETATADDLAETVEQVKALDRRVIAAEADVRDTAAMRDVVEQAVADLGRLDIVVANAGIVSFAPALELTDEAWQDVIDVNLTGVWRTCVAAIPSMIAAGNGGRW